MGCAVAIVLGSSANALQEFAAAQALAPDAPVLCVNGSLRACSVRPIAFATLHPEKSNQFFRTLDVEGIPLYTMEPQPYAKREWIIVRDKWGGTSGLYAVQVALEALDFAGVIVAGVPIDHRARTNYQLHGKPWANGYEDRYRRGWLKSLPAIGARVRSMSGWTQEILGPPSQEWISGLSATA